MPNTVPPPLVRSLNVIVNLPLLGQPNGLAGEVTAPNSCSLMLSVDSVDDVVKVPLTGFVCVALSYRQVPTFVTSSAKRIGRAAALQLPPRSWNSSVAIAVVERRHHGSPLVPVSVVTVVSPPRNDLVVHSGSGAPDCWRPVPPNLAVSMSPSTVPVVFFVSLPVMIAVEHSIVPRLVTIRVLPTLTPSTFVS